MPFPVTDLWFRSPLSLREIATRLGLADVCSDSENYWTWEIGTLNGARLDITRTHTKPPETADTRIFLVDNTKFSEELIVEIVSRLQSFIRGAITCGRWEPRSGNDFHLMFDRAYFPASPAANVTLVNDIQNTRDDLERTFDPSRIIPGEHVEERSPCGRYHLVVDVFGTAEDPGFPSVVLANIKSTVTGEVIATVKRNDDRLFYTWISRDGHDYLIFPEHLEGQTILDLTARRVEGFFSRDESFIWTEFHPSPDKTKMAIIGCYWACSYMVTVYDFRNPMSLPLPLLAQFTLPEANAKFKEWISENAFGVTDDQGILHVFEVPQPKES